jgi:hypothetical protein
MTPNISKKTNKGLIVMFGVLFVIFGVFFVKFGVFFVIFKGKPVGPFLYFLGVFLYFLGQKRGRNFLGDFSF